MRPFSPFLPQNPRQPGPKSGERTEGSKKQISADNHSKPPRRVLGALILAVAFLNSAHAEEIPQAVKESQLAFEKATTEKADAPFEEGMKALRDRYRQAITSALKAAASRSRLDDSLALKAELVALDGNSVPAEGEPGVNPEVLRLRTVWHQEIARLNKDRAARLQTIALAYDAILRKAEEDLTRTLKLEDAKAVREMRDGLKELLEVPASRLLSGGKPNLKDGLDAEQRELAEKMLKALPKSLTSNALFENDAKSWITQPGKLIPAKTDPTALVGVSTVVFERQQLGYYRLKSEHQFSAKEGEKLKAWILHREPFQNGDGIHFLQQNAPWHAPKASIVKATKMGDWLLTEAECTIPAKGDYQAQLGCITRPSFTINCFIVERLERQ